MEKKKPLKKKSASKVMSKETRTEMQMNKHTKEGKERLKDILKTVKSIGENTGTGYVLVVKTKTVKNKQGVNVTFDVCEFSNEFNEGMKLEITKTMVERLMPPGMVSALKGL